MWDEAGKMVGLGKSALRWRVDIQRRDITERYRIGLLRDKRIKGIIWTAKMVEDKDLAS